MIPKGLERGVEELDIGGWMEIIQSTALLKSARMPRRVLDTWGDLRSLRPQWKTISKPRY